MANPLDQLMQMYSQYGGGNMPNIPNMPSMPNVPNWPGMPNMPQNPMMGQGMQSGQRWHPQGWSPFQKNYTGGQAQTWGQPSMQRQPTGGAAPQQWNSVWTPPYG